MTKCFNSERSQAPQIVTVPNSPAPVGVQPKIPGGPAAASQLPRIPVPVNPKSVAIPGSKPAPTGSPPRPPREQLPDLSKTAKFFPKGPDANSPKILNRGPPGPYQAIVTTNAAFPNRTVYLPLNVPAGVKVPIFAWENGICYRYGRMYQAFLQEIASHGYFVIARGEPTKLDPGRTNAEWQMERVRMARNMANAPVTVDKSKVAIGGHSCGGGETVCNLASAEEGEITTGLIFNSGGQESMFEEVLAPDALGSRGRS
jgi:hypothetical protein